MSNPCRTSPVWISRLLILPPAGILSVVIDAFPVFAFFLRFILFYILFRLNSEKNHVYPVGQNAQQDRFPSNDGHVQPHIDPFTCSFSSVIFGHTLGLWPAVTLCTVPIPTRTCLMSYVCGWKWRWRDLGGGGAEVDWIYWLDETPIPGSKR